MEKILLIKINLEISKLTHLTKEIEKLLKHKKTC